MIDDWLYLCHATGVQPFWLEGQVHKFKTSRGPDNWESAEIENFEMPKVSRGREWEGGVLLPSRLGSLGERRKLPKRGRALPQQKTVFGVF